MEHCFSAAESQAVNPHFFQLIENAEIIENEAIAGAVGHGSTVTVKDLEDGSELKYQIVGSQEANPMQSLISSDSPFGRSLLGHAVGEQITVDAPMGQFRFEILKIEN